MGIAFDITADQAGDMMSKWRTAFGMGQKEVVALADQVETELEGEFDPEFGGFGYAEIESEERWAAVASTDVCRRWWRHMRELMPSNPDDSPVSRELREVFHIERTAGARP